MSQYQAPHPWIFPLHTPCILSLSFFFNLVWAGNFHQLQPQESCLIHHAWRDGALERFPRQEEAALLVRGGAETAPGPLGPEPVSPQPRLLLLQGVHSQASSCTVGMCESRPCTSQPLTSHCVVQTELWHISLCLQPAWISPREQSSENSQAVAPSTVKDARGQNAPFVGYVCEALCCFYKGGKQHSESHLGLPPHIPPQLLAGTLRF